MHFALPALLYGLLAAATPFLIHWFLRPRPRRVIFPTVSLMKPALASGRRAQRMRDLWLLAVRAALLGLLAFLLAGPSCSATAAQPESSQPIAAALVIDDSWSVRYRLDAETTLLDRCGDRALAEVQSALAWPQPSALGVWFASAASAPQELTADFAAARERIKAEESASPHAQPLGAALRAAAQRLAGARQPLRRLIVVTDGAAHAWRDVPPGALTGIDGISVRIATPEIERRTNLALTDVRGPQRMHPETMPIPIRVSVRAAGLETRCTLVVREGSRVLLRHGPVEVAPDATRDLTLLVPPLPRGPHGLSVTVEPADRLDFDQTRFAAIQCGKRPVAWLVAPEADADDEDLSATLYANLLAPEALESRWQIVSLKRLTPDSLNAEIAAAAGDAVPELIVVTAGTRLGDAARAGVTRLVEGGATLLLACSSRDGATDWPGLRPWIARSAPLAQTLDAPTTLAWESSTTLPTNDEGLDELKRATISRRVQLTELVDGAAIHARFADGAPAIVSVRVGRGQVFALATSPDPQWSEWGTRAAGLLTLLHELVQRAAPPPDAIASLTAGEVSRFPLPRETAATSVTVTRQSADGAKPIEVKLADGRPADNWPADAAGVYAIRTSAADPPIALYAVNWPVEESDLSPISIERLRALLGVADVSFAESAARDATALSWPQRLGLRDPADVFLILLLTLLIAEMLLAARKKPRAGYATDAGS